MGFALHWQVTTCFFESLSHIWLCSPPASSVRGTIQARTWVGCHFFLQGIFPTQRLNRVSYVSCIGRQVLYHWATWETFFLHSFSFKPAGHPFFHGGPIVLVVLLVFKVREWKRWELDLSTWSLTYNPIHRCWPRLEPTLSSEILQAGTAGRIDSQKTWFMSRIFQLISMTLASVSICKMEIIVPTLEKLSGLAYTSSEQHMGKPSIN